VPGIAIGFDIQFAFGAVDGKVQRVILTTRLDKFLTLGSAIFPHYAQEYDTSPHCAMWQGPPGG
jgi:hypothetical protein